MHPDSTDSLAPARSQAWRWWVCGLLLLATMINYMDRLTLNLLADHIQNELGLDDARYGNIESGFGIAFAVGAIVFGFIVDRWNVFWVYPLALIAWSSAGFFTGFAGGFASLMMFRMLLGFAEASNWPCALRTTQRILPPSERGMGNSILQSGAAVGAILIPIVLFFLFNEKEPTTWRMPFLVVGAAGTVWVVFWWVSIRPADLALKSAATDVSLAHTETPLPRAVFVRRLIVLIVIVITINMTWHYLRAWLPKYLKAHHGFSQSDTNWFSIAYYVFTDVGALTAGFVSMRLAKSGMGVHASRRLVFLCGALMTTLLLVVPFVQHTGVLIGMLLVVGFGSLGVFPCYYSFSQDLTKRHQGKLTGSLGACCWIAMSFWQTGIGETVKHTGGSYLIPFLISGLVPMLGWVTLLAFWGPVEEGKPLTVPPADPLRPPSAEGDERIQGDVRAVQVAKRV